MEEEQSLYSTIDSKPHQSLLLLLLLLSYGNVWPASVCLTHTSKCVWLSPNHNDLYYTLVSSLKSKLSSLYCRSIADQLASDPYYYVIVADLFGNEDNADMHGGPGRHNNDSIISGIITNNATPFFWSINIHFICVKLLSFSSQGSASFNDWIVKYTPARVTADIATITQGITSMTSEEGQTQITKFGIIGFCWYVCDHMGTLR